jgi:hypothetical protein
MERFKKSTVHCIFTIYVVCFCFGVHAQGILGTTSENGVNILFQDGFNASSLDLVAPFDLTKWCKSNENGTPANPTIQTAVWGTHNGYESSSTHYLQQVITSSQGVYLWSPEIVLPNRTDLMARVSIRRSGFTGGGTLTIRMAFDGNNDLVPEASPTQISLINTGAGPYNDYSSGNFFAGGSDNSRLVYFDLSTFGNRTGRLGILLKSTSMTMGETFQIDWFVVGTRPTNDLCGANAYGLVNGLNGGTNGFYNTTAGGATPTLNATPGGRAGGCTLYVGDPASNGLSGIPKDGTSVIDGYNPVLTANDPGVFSLAAHKVENTTWYQFTTPPNPTDCGQPVASPLRVDIILRDLSCARNSVNISSNMQGRIFPFTVCGTATQASTVATTNTLSPWANNATLSATGLAYNTTYVLVIDGINGNDCRFKLETQTFINGTHQPTNPCTILPITIKDFIVLPEFDGTVSLKWSTYSERNNDFFTIERSTDGVNYVEIHKQVGAGNSTSELNYGAVDFLPEPGLNYYRLKQTDFDGNFEYFEPVAVNVIPAMLNMTLIPNPTSRDASVLLSSRSRQHVSIEVIDLTGKQLYHTADFINEGNTSFTMPSETWNSGTYIVRVITDKETLTEKLIVNL